MSEIPEPKQDIAELIYRHYESQQEKPRPHLGASMLGHYCDRWLWLSFRWAVVEKFPGRVLRLFERGQNEERIIINNLKSIGIDVQITINQTRVNLGGHLGGSIDAIINSGIPLAAKTKHIAEFKTHSLKSFNDLIKNGVYESKPQHWAQMQCYMHGSGIDRALYVAVCKDDDRIYTERVKYDQDAAESIIERGHRITLSERMPEPISSDPSWYQCKFCAAHEFCFDTGLTREVNCRTCAHSTPVSDGTWDCARFEASDIPIEHQYDGCECHVLHPDMVPWQISDSPNPHEAVYEINGVQVRNGEPCANCYGSKEIIANSSACASGDPVIADVREKLGALIVDFDNDIPF